MRRSPHLREILTLDPERDCRRVVFLDTFHEFPFDTTRALELAFFKTFAVPSIAELLDSTGEFTRRGQKRYDDTDLLISAFSEDGWDGPLGARALRRMNRIHGRFAIANEDYLYVLSAMVLEPLRWNERFGWRPMVEAERQAQYYFWREVGRRMNIKDIPPTLAELDAFNREAEQTRFAPTEAGPARRAGAARRLPRLVPLGAEAARSARDRRPRRRARRRGARPSAPDAARATRGGGRAPPSRAGRAPAADAPPAAAADDDAAPHLSRRLSHRAARTATARRGYADRRGPVAQRIERQTSNLRAEVRLLPGPLGGAWRSSASSCSSSASTE